MKMHDDKLGDRPFWLGQPVVDDCLLLWLITISDQATPEDPDRSEKCR